MPEWTIGAVCKTAARKGYLSSNLSLSTMATGVRLKAKIAPFAAILRGIAHPHRLAIVYLLAHHPLRVRDLMQKVGIAQSLMAHHLKFMEKTGWVRKTRDGRHMLYELNKKAFKEMRRLLIDTPFWQELTKV